MRRTYAPGIARFLSQVRLEEQLAGEHTFSYALNNPVNYVDPNGTSPKNPPSKSKCVVVVCDQYGWNNGIITHEYICAITSSGQECSGGLFGGAVKGTHPTPIFPGHVQGPVTPKGQSACVSHNVVGPGGQFLYPIKCRTVTTDCNLAALTCKCLTQLTQNPPAYLFPFHVCKDFPYDVSDCINQITGGKSELPGYTIPDPGDPDSGVPG